VAASIFCLQLQDAIWRQDLPDTIRNLLELFLWQIPYQDKHQSIPTLDQKLAPAVVEKLAAPLPSLTLSPPEASAPVSPGTFGESLKDGEAVKAIHVPQMC